MKALITGNKSGLGRYLSEGFGGAGLDKETSFKEREKIKKGSFDVIIHCAFNSLQEVNSETLFPYIEDNVFLTKELTAIRHKKFIFFSSIDVYPKNKTIHSEEEIIGLNSIKGIYGLTKLISESIVGNYCKNYLILRGTAFLGPYSRKNSLIKIIEAKECDLTLTGDSEFNYVLHSDILNFLKVAIKRDLRGIYNLSSSKNITISEIAKTLGKKVRFGEYQYNTGKINNKKISSIFSAFKKTSREAVDQFVKKEL
ncbi:MAG: NAD(P)-dependent oxidoreductase [bacterium]|nr:NAD(P)-dependent oxidoreductase [bacterium]